MCGYKCAIPYMCSNKYKQVWIINQVNIKKRFMIL